jgi:hypothetical protein
MIRVREVLDRASDRTARGLLAWSARRVERSRRVWIDEIRWQLDEIDGGWARLIWALGGLRLVWTMGPSEARRYQDTWPESWSIVASGMLLGVLAWLVFATRLADLERTPAELMLGFLGLYFYSAGFLSGRRTGQIGTGAWAGATCGLVFGAVAYFVVFSTAMDHGLNASARLGAVDLFAIAWSGLLFFVLMGAGCGALGARAARQAAARQTATRQG